MMAALSNLIPNPGTKDNWVSRPASSLITNFSGFSSPQYGEALYPSGTRLYGMIQSSLNAGKSQPFIYDTNASAFISVSGITAANTPTSTSNSGDWTPPTMTQVGAYILVTHPGFNFGAGYAFGWFDMSGFTETTTGNVSNGSSTITGNPIIAGVTAGQTVTGTDIPAGTRVVSFDEYVNDTTGTTNGTTTVSSVGNLTGIAIGQVVSGENIALGTTVAALPGGGDVTLSTAATGSATGQAITFSGATITMSANATGSASSESITIAGGTFAAPLWSAGNLNITPLVALPTAVTQYADSACFAVNTSTSAAVVFSDAGDPLSCQGQSQIITFQNAVAITALQPQGFFTLSGGITQSLLAFQGPSAIQQLTGTPILETLAINTLNDSVGTNAPNSIAQTPNGTLFVAPDGVRLISLVGQVTPAIGRAGDGICEPFLFAENPSRIAAAYNEGVYRASVTNAALVNTPTQDWWFHQDDQRWSGPHTFPASIIVPTQIPHSFAMFAAGVPAKLWASDAYASLAATYVENGVQMEYTWKTSLLPDNQQMAMNAIVQTDIAISIPALQNVQFNASDEFGNIIGEAELYGPQNPGAIWGDFLWGDADWGAGETYYVQQIVRWTAPMTFKQLQVSAMGNCDPDLNIGNLYMRYQELGYNLPSFGGRI
jgi:hypothetical protein